MELIARTRPRCAELADQIEDVCEQPFDFRGDDPNMHSYHNHRHLWWLEWWADRMDWVNLAFRVRVAETIMDRWQTRLKGFAPYQTAGYRLYLYEWVAPTMSAVAETPEGFPYPGKPVFLDHPRDIMALYVGRSWAGNFQRADVPSDTQILAAIEAEKGAIGRPTANRLGMKPGALRKLIENCDLQDPVNALRKRYNRRPATFRTEVELLTGAPFKVYERRLPPGYA